MKDNKWRVLAMYGGEDVAYIKLFWLKLHLAMEFITLR